MAKILIVEDERVAAWSIQESLENFGHTVVANVVSGIEAIQTTAETQPDLVLMDIQLKGKLDGIATAAEIRSQFRIPIVYLTAHADSQTLRRAIATAAFGYLVKPFNQTELHTTIEIALLRHDMESRLESLEQRLSTTLSSIGEGTIATDTNGHVVFMNPMAENMTGWQEAEALGQSADSILNLVNPETGEHENPVMQVIRDGKSIRPEDNYVLRTKDGAERAISDTATPIRNADGEVTGSVVVFHDVTNRKQVEETLRQQAERERLMGAIAQRIRQSLQLEDILTTTASEVRQFLQTDRVIIFRLETDGHGTVIVESVGEGWQPMLGRTLYDPCFATEACLQTYLQGQVQTIEDVQTSAFAPCYIELLQDFQIKSHILVAIPQADRLWGLLIAQTCDQPRQWQSWESDLLSQLSTQVAIAIQQAELYERVQQFNLHLEQQVRERTVELRQALDFEALLKRITEKVRDSLDERQILETTVQELAIELKSCSCDTGLYDLEQRTSTIAYEHIRSNVPTAKNQVVDMHSPGHEQLYHHLMQGQSLQFCWRDMPLDSIRATGSEFAILACPLIDDQGVIGDMWLYRPHDLLFSTAEIRLIEQVANQCAIAIRQARLYKASQAQVMELERLNRLKNDFLNTISHELRTPVASIKMAGQMLEIRLRQAGFLEGDSDLVVGRYLEILQDECDREINLINNMLDLSRLDAQVEPITPTSIALQDWVPHLIEPFLAQIQRQQQQLRLEIPVDLPPLVSDLSSLGRLLTELINNACKYTPAAETIHVTAQLIEKEPPPLQKAHYSNYIRPAASAAFKISVSNSGVEIPPSEQSRIFDKFYRIPNADPWRHGGTGLGLALVRRLANHIGATIQVHSTEGWTRFTVLVPAKP